jgi:TorA maturation chaperone TorD
LPAAVQQEHDGLFGGVGKAEVTPYLSAYADRSAPERYLVGLRQRLAGWGLARREGVGEVEDHIAGVADVMRWLIEHGHPLGEQRQFFAQYVYPGAVHFFPCVQNAPAAIFFRRVADLAAAFFELEKTAFEMEDGG